MKYSAVLLGALAALVNAVQITNVEFNVVAGEPFTITWSEAVGDVTIKLKNGDSGDLKDVETLTTSGSGGSFTWTPESDLPSDTYAFEIVDSTGVPNYSSQFTYQGTGTASATSSTASSTTTTGTSSTTTSTESESTTSSANTTTTMTSVSNSTTLTTSTSTSSSSSETSSTASSTSASSTSTATGVPNTNNGQRIASSLALVLGVVAAFAAFN